MNKNYIYLLDIVERLDINNALVSNKISSGEKN